MGDEADDQSTGQRTVELLEELLGVAREQNEKLSGVIDLLSQPGIDLSPLEDTLTDISTTLDTFLQDWVVANQPPPPIIDQAVTGTLSVQTQGGSMTIQVTDTGDELFFQFDDSFGNIAAPPTGDGSGITVTFGTDTPSIASAGGTTVGTDSAGNALYSAGLTFAGPDGAFNATCLVANVSDPTGANLTDDDGVTAFVQPANLALVATAGQAVTGETTEGTTAP